MSCIAHFLLEINFLKKTLNLYHIGYIIRVTKYKLVITLVMRIIEFYKTESDKNVILDFLESLPVKHKAGAIREIELLVGFGTKLTMPHVKQINRKLLELRIKTFSDISRIFYFVSVSNKIVLLHGFIKKTAIKRMADYKRRFKI